MRNGNGENGIRRSSSDAQVLRDELARQIAGSTRKDRVVERQTAVIAELRMEIEFKAEIGQVREQGKAPQADRAGSCASSAFRAGCKNPNSPPSQNPAPAKKDRGTKKGDTKKDGDASRMKYYENPNSPPSQNSIPTMRNKADSRKPASEHKTPGRKEHPGSTSKPRSTFTVRHDPEKCENCGGENITRDTSRSRGR